MTTDHLIAASGVFDAELHIALVVHRAGEGEHLIIQNNILPSLQCPQQSLPCTVPSVGELVSLELDQGSRLAGGVLQLPHDLVVLGRQATVRMKTTVSLH